MDVVVLAVLLAVEPVPLAPRAKPEQTEVKPDGVGVSATAESEASESAAPNTARPDAAVDTPAEATVPANAEVAPTPAAEPVPGPPSGEPDRVAEPSPPVADHDRPAFKEAPRYSNEEIAPTSTQKPRRVGGFVSLSAGAGQCGSWCGHMAALGGGRIEAGYRWGFIALGASASLVGGKFDTPASTGTDFYSTEDARGSTRFLHIGPMLQFFPASRGRFDPYLSAGIGYRRAVEFASIEGVDGEEKYWESGLGVTVGAGVPLYVTERVTVGLRYDKTFAVGGNLCLTVGGETPPGAERCEVWSKLTDELNTVHKRYARLGRPRPWTVAFEMRVAF